MSALLQTLGTGGPVLILLAVLSLASLTAIIAKWIELAPTLRGEDSRRNALGQWRRGEGDSARKSIGSDTPADRVLAFAMTGLNEDLSPALLASETERRGNSEITRLNRGIRLLELIAMVSPLLGLLGTVLGMIQSFQELELAEGAANASILAGGIWQALLTTAAGLLVAIPAAIAAGLFAARIERVAVSIESAVGGLMLAEEVARKSPVRK